MLGSSGVGKTSLVHKFLSGNYSNSIDAYGKKKLGETESMGPGRGPEGGQGGVRECFSN